MAVSSIRERIKAVRKALSLSQRDFCKRIFLSQSFYGQIETGRKTPNERVYELICNKYKVNKDWLLTGKGEMFNETPPDVELDLLIEIYKELDPLFREYIIQQIKQILSVQKRTKQEQPSRQ
jgi:transcriptional regulator with XRE-family HTH domain